MACCRAGGTEYSSTCMGSFEGDHHYLHYLHPQFAAAAATAKSLQLCLTLCDPRQQPTRLPRPWDSPGKNTGVGCRFLLQCVKVKSESEVAQSCLTPSDPMDCSLPGSSIHGIFQARVLEWVIVWTQVNKREGTWSHPPTENWIKDLLNMAPPIRTRPNFSQSLPSGSFHKPLVMSDSLLPHGLYSLWNSLGQNTGVDSLSLLQGIFSTQGSNKSHALQADSLPAEPQGKPPIRGQTD